MTGKRALRYASEADMPPGMREKVRLAAIDAAAKMRAMRPVCPPPTNKPTPKRTNKFAAKPTHVHGIRFDSTREARYYEQLLMRQKVGEVTRFHRQVIFDLEGGIIYKCDFLVFYPDGTHEYIDVKGFQTKEFRMKMRMVRARYGVEVHLA